MPPVDPKEWDKFQQGFKNNFGAHAPKAPAMPMEQEVPSSLPEPTPLEQELPERFLRIQKLLNLK